MSDLGASTDDPRGRPTLAIQDRESHGRHVLVLTGELDIAYAVDLAEVIDRLLVDGVTAITLDLGKLTFMDSTGLQALLTAHRRCREHGCDLYLTPPSEPVRRLFEVTGVSDVLPIMTAEEPTTP